MPAGHLEFRFSSWKIYSCEAIYGYDIIELVFITVFKACHIKLVANKNMRNDR